MKGPPIVLGIVALAVGLGTGYLIVAHPGGLNPSWPIGMALLAPAAFTLGGVFLLSQGLGYPKPGAAAMTGIAVCLLAIAHWAAFFTARVPCRESLSLFGVPLLERYPSDAACRSQLQGILVFVDGVVGLFVAAFAVHRMRRRAGRPAD